MAATDVDSVIARHQRRLEEHRQFLREQGGGGVEGGSASLARGTTAADWTGSSLQSTSDAQVPAVSNNVEWGSAAAAAISNPAAARTNARGGGSGSGGVQRYSSAGAVSPSTTNRSGGGGAAAHRDPMAALSSSRISSGPSYSPDRHSAHTGSTTSVGGAVLANFGRAYTNPTGAEPYVVQSPTRLYERGQMFVAAHNRQVQALRGEREARELADCTFRPSREKAIEAVSQQRTQRRANDGRGDAGDFSSEERSRTSAVQKTFLRSTQRRERSGSGNDSSGRSGRHEKKPLGPEHWNASVALGRRGDAGDRAKSPSVGGSSALARQLALSPSICTHVARQAAARHLREDLQRRNFRDGSGWTGEPTVPVGFKFAERVTGISSLRKPVVVDYTAARGRNGSPKRGAGSVDDDDGLYVRARPRTPRTGASPDKRRATASSAVGGSVTDNTSAGSGDDAAVVLGVDPQIIAKVHTQEAEIDKLHGLVSTLQRELSVAKAKVREVSLQQQVREQQQQQQRVLAPEPGGYGSGIPPAVEL